MPGPCRPPVSASGGHRERPRYRRRGPSAQQGEDVITIAELGEFGLIKAIGEVFTAAAADGTSAGRGTGAGLVLGIGDDAAVVRAPDGRVVATTDMLIEGTHFRREWSSARDIGHKAVARNLADVAAMGALPTALLVCFAGPGDTPVDWVLDLARGIAEESAAAGAAVAGGDTSRAQAIMLAVTALGDLAGREPVTRSGAKPGDVIAVAGSLGSAAAGLGLLVAGPAAGPLPADMSAELIGAHRRPRPPYAAGAQAAAIGATSMIDISDGLVADLGHLAAASGVRMEIDSRRVAAEPVCRVSALRAAAEVLGRNGWLDWVAAGGEDHALAATFPSTVVLPERWVVIGEVTVGRGVLVDSRPWTADITGGWEHFRP